MRAVDLLGKLPLDISIRNKQTLVKPSVFNEPDGRIAEIYSEIAKKKLLESLPLNQKDYSSKFPRIVIDNGSF